MIGALNRASNPELFTRLATKVKNCTPIDESNVVVKNISQNFNDPKVAAVCPDVFSRLAEGDVKSAIDILKAVLPPDAAIKQTSLGTAVMAKGWEKPIVFPKEGNFKWLGWVDEPAKLTTEEVWKAAYGEKPAAIVGAVGNSNIKPEHVKGGCSLSKKELSAKYEEAIVDFFRPIFTYLNEIGLNTKKVGIAFAHSDCGVDKAARKVVEENGLKGLATTPTEYTQYLRGKECPPSAEFPNGFILADFPFPTVLTRGVSQISDYANVYKKLVGEKNPLGVFGGGQHAYCEDALKSYLPGESIPIPVDIMKDRFGIVIPAKTEDGKTVLNSARNMLEKINGNPYAKYKFAFDEFLPNSKTKSDIMQYDPQMAMTTILYSRLANSLK